jgi:polar amino acid transport system substrate-binding protein
MKKKLILLLAALTIVAAAFMVTGCGEEEKEAGDWEYIEKNGKIIVGLDATFAPMGFTDKDDNIVGFDVDLAKAVGEKLGVEMEFKSIDWDAKYTELEAKNIDCIWNGMSATPERAEKLSLSKEYFNNKIIVMTLKDDVKVDKAADLANYNVGIQADSSALEVVKENKDYDSFKDKIKEYKSYDDAITDMQAGRMDCVVIDEVLGNYKNTKMKNALKECKYNFGDDFYAIGFRKDDKELTKKVNDALQELIDEDEAAKISKKWFGKDLVILQDYEAE